MVLVQEGSAGVGERNANIDAKCKSSIAFAKVYQPFAWLAGWLVGWLKHCNLSLSFSRVQAVVREYCCSGSPLMVL